MAVLDVTPKDAERGWGRRLRASLRCRRNVAQPDGARAGEASVAPVGSDLEQQAEGAELGRDLVDGVPGVLLLAGAGAHQLAAAEDEDDDLGVGEAVDEAGELLGLVLDVLQPEADGDGVEVQLGAEVAGG